MSSLHHRHAPLDECHVLPVFLTMFYGYYITVVGDYDWCVGPAYMNARADKQLMRCCMLHVEIRRGEDELY